MQTDPTAAPRAAETRDAPTRDAPASQPEAGFHDLLIGRLPALRQQALALARNRADADDLVQAAVTNALAARASFTPGTNFAAWMSRILRNGFISAIRRRRETVDLADVPGALLGRSGGQEEGLEMQELRRLLARLPADHRLALLLITVQGLSYDEASAELGVAVGTLKCRVFRARRLLRLWLLGEDAPPAPERSPAAPRAGAGVSRRRGRAEPESARAG
jgi:RNA polymerase sigma-70 factor (ECF subfamily)